MLENSWYIIVHTKRGQGLVSTWYVQYYRHPPSVASLRPRVSVLRLNVHIDVTSTTFHNHGTPSRRPYILPALPNVLRVTNMSQVSDEEDGNMNPVAIADSPRPKELALDTALESVASYSFTPNGAILLRGFQSPIPQSGLMAAALREESLATEYSSPTGGDPLTDALANADGSVGNQNAECGVVTPMNERVVLLRRVGEGATGVVYRAFDLLDLRLVAVKVIPVNNQQKRRQLVHEISSLYDRLRTQRRRERRRTEAEVRIPSPRSPAVTKPSFVKRNSSWSRGDVGRTVTSPTSPQDGSEHILELIDVFVTKSNSTLSLVVEYMDGGSLQVCRWNGEGI